MKVSAGNKVVLIGAGDVGVAYAYALVNQGICDHLAIIDIDERKTEGNVMDLNHGVVWAPSRTKVTRGTYADCEDAAAIAQFNNEFGITTYPVKKGPDSRRFGYRWLQGLFEIVIDPRRCPNCAREFQLMEYKQDRRTGEFMEDYPKEADHSIDAVRYAVEQDSMKLGLF